jgi:RHS repeat-associated protein
MAFKSVLRLLLLCFSIIGVAWGQDAGNPPNLQTVPSDDFGVDSIDLQSLSIGISAPVISKPGAIPFSFSLQGSSYCGVIPFAANGHAVECGIGPTKDYGTVSNVPFQNWLPMGVNGVVAEWGASWQLGYNIDTIVTCGTSTTHKHTDLFISGPDYTTYPLPAADYIEIGGCTHDIDDYTVLGGIHVVTTGGIPAITFPNGNVRGLASVTDPFGNVVSYSSGTTSYTDTLGTTIDITPSGRTTGTPGTYYWTDTTGTQQHMSEVVTAATLKTTFGCGTTAADQTYTGEVLSEIDYPDGHNLLFSYEPVSGGVTGRISQITLRTGGTVSYTYGAPLICNSKGLIPSSVSRVTSDGTTTYTVATFTGASGKFGTTTTILDPGKNKRVLTFMGTDQWGNGQFSVPLLVTQVQTYKNTGTVASPSYPVSANQTTLYCYNNNTTSCATTQASYPITAKDVYVTLDGKSTSSRAKYTYDTYGNVTEIDRYPFTTVGTGTIDNKTVITYGSWNGSTCVAVGSNIVNLPCRITTTNGAGTLTLSDQVNAYSSKGFLTATSKWKTGSTWIVLAQATANPNGTTNTSTNSTGAVTTYSYAGTGGCNAILPTGTSVTVNSVTMTTSATWDCNMGKLLTSTDANSNQAIFTYDLLGRPHSQEDPANVYTLTETYPSQTTQQITDSTYFTTTNTVDGLGRLVRSQKTDGASYDTVSTGYAYNGTQFRISASQPCITTLNADCTKNHFQDIDPLGRTFSTSTTSNETVASTFSQNDVSVQLIPAPSGENTKTTQTEFDGLGRVSKVCALEATGGTACGQFLGNSGILNSFTYTYGSGTVQVDNARGSQTHTTIADALGRVTSVKLPETGATATTYVYDTENSGQGCGARTSNGALLRKNYSDGSFECYVVDSLGRTTDIGSSASAPAAVCKRFRFDSTSSSYGGYTAPTGYTGANTGGRLMEAATDDCTFPLSQAHMITDEWFAYDDDGRVTDVWETTPNSAGFYHTTQSYYSNGQLNALSGVPGKSTYTITLDTNGRPDASTYGATTVGRNVNWNAAGQPTQIDTNSSTDNDQYTYDANTGLMKTWSFTIGALNESATLTWNPNRTLKTLAITDGFNASGTQTCNYNPTDHTGTGYDDVGRLVGFYCGASENQTFAYTDYDNLTKSGTTSWNPVYSTTNNHYTGATYDGNGRVTYDLNNSFAWDVYGKMITANSGASLGSCGAAGVTCVTYDAFGRPAEKNVAGTVTEFLYSPIGLTATMSGTTTQNMRVPVPGGAIFNSSSTGLGNTVLHVDWLGTARVGYSLGGSKILETSMTPYGEKYATSTGTGLLNFTGDFQDLFSGLYDTPNREFDVASGSRWLSPDPAMASWNAYAYPTNPNSFIDPSGLRGCNPRRCTSNNEVGVGDNGGYDYQFSWGTAYGNSGLLSTAAGVVGSTSSSSLFQGTFSPAGTSANVDVTGVSSTILDTGAQQGTTIRLYNNTSNANFYTGMSTGNGLSPIQTANGPHRTGAGKKIHPKIHPKIQMADWFYQVTGRKWTSGGDGPMDNVDSPESWSQLETNAPLPPGENIQVNPTGYLLDEGSGLNWVDVTAGEASPAAAAGWGGLIGILSLAPEAAGAGWATSMAYDAVGNPFVPQSGSGLVP